MPFSRYNSDTEQESPETKYWRQAKNKSKLTVNEGKVYGCDSNSACMDAYDKMYDHYDRKQVYLNNQFQPRIDTRVLSVNPNNYVLMLSDLPFNDQINLFNTGTFGFAKIYLAGQLNDFVYDQYVQLGSTFQEPLATLSTITFSFYGPDNNLYDFNNVEHSFTIEIIEQLDELNILGIETG
jgi:hypothetical protein